MRAAVAADIPALESLIAQSARVLGRGHYSAAETEAAITHVFGVDSELVADGTYLVVEAGERIAGCGGWSRRPTLFGGDRFAARQSGLLNPATDPAKIRAFFVHPDFARQGVADALLSACEAAAAAAGFHRLELMATLPGLPFYRARGFVAGAAQPHLLDGIEVTFVPMAKALSGNIVT